MINNIQLNRFDILVDEISKNHQYPSYAVSVLVIRLIQKHWNQPKICAIYFYDYTGPFAHFILRKNIIHEISSEIEKINFLNYKGLAAWFTPNKSNLKILTMSSEFLNSKILLTPLSKKDSFKAPFFLGIDRWKHSEFEFFQRDGYDFEYLSWVNPKISIIELKKDIDTFLTKN